MIKAAALALRGHPRLNAELRDDVIVLHPQIHVGFAVALDEGLIVPVTRDTDALPLDELAPISADLAVRARERRLGPDDLTGGTFTVTSLGMYGIDVFTPIINQPPRPRSWASGGSASGPSSAARATTWSGARS